MRYIFVIMLFLFILSQSVFAGDYIIGDGDSLEINVWGSPKLSLETTVRPDGKISVPAVGEIEVSGLTPMELTKFLEKKMRKVVKTPIITIIMTGMTNYRIFVIGRGVWSGVHQLTRGTTLLEFLAQLGSFDNAGLENDPFYNAGLENAYLVRNKNKIKEDFTGLFEKGDISQDIRLEANDILFIPDNFENRISVVGAVNEPTTIPFRNGLTILDVILHAGGFTQFAKEKNVKILRKMENSRVEKLSVNARDLMQQGYIEENIEMKPGDLVIVRESVF